VNFDVTSTTDQIFCIHQILEKSGSTMRQYISYVRFEVFVGVTMKNGLFWDVTPCGCCNN
jgi:hypothetical protein